MASLKLWIAIACVFFLTQNSEETLLADFFQRQPSSGDSVKGGPGNQGIGGSGTKQNLDQATYAVNGPGANSSQAINGTLTSDSSTSNNTVAPVDSSVGAEQPSRVSWLSQLRRRRRR